jgi:hypothetical protein
MGSHRHDCSDQSACRPRLAACAVAQNRSPASTDRGVSLCEKKMLYISMLFGCSFSVLSEEP